MSDTILNAAPDQPGAVETSASTQPDAISTARPRDEQGRFVAQQPESKPEPQPSKFSPQLVDLARTVYYTDEQINSFSDPGLLYEAVLGRMTTLPKPNQQLQDQRPQVPNAVSTPSAATVTPVPGLSDFTLKLPDDFEPELAAPMKELSSHVNQMRAAFEKRLAEKDAEIKQLSGFLSQQAASTQEMNQQQQAGFWDRVAESVPGLVDQVGLPSQAMIRPGSPESSEWQKLAAMIHANAVIQGVPPHLIDYGRAARDGWTAYQAVKGGNGKRNGQGNGTLPGVAARGVARSSVPVSSTTHAQSVQDDYEARLAAARQAWAANGNRNPYL